MYPIRRKRDLIVQCDPAEEKGIESAPTGVTTNTWNYENQMAGTILPSDQRATIVYNADFCRIRSKGWAADLFHVFAMP